MQNATLLLGRILMAHIFILSGIDKIGGYAGTQAYMENMGVPGALLPLVILVEIGAGLALVLGWQTRVAAAALAAFTLLAGLLFHANIADQTQMVQLMKNLAMTGGLLALATAGPGAFSLDRRLRRKTS